MQVTDLISTTTGYEKILRIPSITYKKNIKSKERLFIQSVKRCKQMQADAANYKDFDKKKCL